MKNIFVEGLPGSGKTTLMRALYKKFDGYDMYMEGDLSPLELKWCSYMTEPEYQQAVAAFPGLEAEIEKRTIKEVDHFIVEYTQIITDMPGFHHYMGRYEIYYGRFSFDEFKDIIFNRFQKFTGTGNLFECAFFQNIIEELMLYYCKSEEQIIEFYQELFTLIKQKDFLLVYLYSDDVTGNILNIKQERTDINGVELWFPLMMRYFNDTPYGRKHEFRDAADMVVHFKQRMALEMRIIKEVLREHAIIISGKE